MGHLCQRVSHVSREATAIASNFLPEEHGIAWGVPGVERMSDQTRYLSRAARASCRSSCAYHFPRRATKNSPSDTRLDLVVSCTSKCRLWPIISMKLSSKPGLELFWSRTLPVPTNILQRDNGQFSHFGIYFRRVVEKTRGQQHCQHLGDIVSHVEEKLRGTRNPASEWVSRVTNNFADGPVGGVLA